MKFLLLHILVVVAVLSSCEKAPKCWGDRIVNEGEIVSDTTLCSNCTFLANENTGFVINSTIDLQRIHRGYYRLGDACQLNSFELDEYTLLALPTITTCKHKLKKTVTTDDATKSHQYTIEIEECGDCSETSYQANWVLIPKIKPGYSVKFKTLRVPK